MNILIYRWNAWNQKDIEESLEHLGHTISYVNGSPDSPEEDGPFVEKLVQQLKATRPSFLFSINYFPVLAEGGHQAGIPYVCWNCDGSLLAMYHESVFYDTSFIFTFDRACVSRFRQMGVSHIWHLPLGVNARRLSSFPASSGTMDYDISFVGSLYTKNSFDEIAEKLPPYLAGYLDGALTAQLAVSGGNLTELLLTPEICQQLEEITTYHRSPRSFADIRQLFSSTVLGFKAANLKRCQILQFLSAAGENWSPQAQVHLFTTDSDPHLPMVQLHPPIDYFLEMPSVFRHSAINLNMTVPTILTGIPLRVWDILGCGGFLLTDAQEELVDYFQPEQHLSIYQDIGDLVEKASFYWREPELREKIAARSRDLVWKQHTWDIRWKQLLEQLKHQIS